MIHSAKNSADGMDPEMLLALELSKKTFEEEEQRRIHSNVPDLISIQSPEEIQRNHQIEEIKKLYNNIQAHTQHSFHSEPCSLQHSSSMPPNIPMPNLPQPAAFHRQTSYVQNNSLFPFESQHSQLSDHYLYTAPSTSFHSETIPRFSHSQSSLGLISTDELKSKQDFTRRKTSTQPTCLQSDDLIDFLSPRDISIEEFDPLYKKLSLQYNPTVSNSNAPPENKVNKPPENKKKIAEIKNSEPNSSQSTCTTKSRQSTLKSRQISFDQKTLMTCDDLCIIPDHACSLYKELTLLTEESKKLPFNPDEDVLFLAHVVDYYTIAADTIKVVVTQDDSWPKDTPEEPQKLEFACDVRSTAEEILLNVLLRFLPPATLENNGGEIPLNEYCLKVFGHDEFLEPSSIIGKHTFVANFLASGKDVELEVGQKIRPRVVIHKQLDQKTAEAPTVINQEFFETFHSTLKANIEKCIANPEDRTLRQRVIQSVRVLVTFANKVQPQDLIVGMDMFVRASSREEIQHGVHYIVVAVMRLLRMWSTSAVTDFSVASFISEEIENKNEEEVKDSSKCDEKLLLNVETLHNLPYMWEGKYKSYFVETHLMFGTKSYGMARSELRSSLSKYNFGHVSFQFWAEFDPQLLSLPRETQICFIICGVPAEDPPESSGCGPGCLQNDISLALKLATASLPLFDYDGYLLQGPVLVPLCIMNGEAVFPWGARPLVRSTEAPVLVVKFLEAWREFDNLPREDQDSLMQLIDNGAVSSIGINEDDKLFLWSNRDCLRNLPRALPLVLASSFSWGAYSLSNIYLLLDNWQMTPNVAIELLLPYFQDRYVRTKAIDYIRNASSEFLFNLLTQLVEALRYEMHENSALAVFLLERSLKDRRFAVELYWQLQQRIHDGPINASYSARCQLLQKLLLELNIRGFSDEIAAQHNLLDRLDGISKAVKEAPDNLINSVLRKELYRMSDEIGNVLLERVPTEILRLDMRNVRLPIAPAFQCRSIAVEECGYFNSLTKPIKIIVGGRKNDYGIIFKVGDDLRQDAIVLQLVRVMNDIWLNHNLDLRMKTFRCLPTGLNKGIIELVPDCNTLREIHITSGATGVFKDDVLNNWLVRQNQSEFQYKAALENFRKSCAGWCVATYVLGIGDRHNDNILVTTSGHVFHIDFGKYMGDWQTAGGFKRDRVPFVLTADMAYVINGGSQNTTEYFQRFIDDCCRAFNLLRQNCSMIMNIMRFMSCSDIPGMNGLDSVNFVESNLMLDLNEAQATMVFTRMIEESLKSRFPRLNFFAHTLAQLKNNPMLLASKADDMHRLSFIPEIFTEKQEGRIDSIHVSSFEKWRTPEKKYMYKLLIRRVNERVTTTLYRSFVELQEFHWKLCYRFSSRAIPRLTTTSNFGRSNIKVVARKRQLELENFLQSLFRLPDEVAHSDLVYTFFHTLYRDSEPYTARNPDANANFRNDYLNSAPQILLRLSYDEAKSEFRAFVGHARQLPLIGNCTPPDSYVKTYLREMHAPQQKYWKRKTLVVKNAQNPTYNAEIVYSLGTISAPEFMYMILEVSVWHSGSAVLKDNFQLCDCLISLKDCFKDVSVDRKGLKVVEKWHTLRLSLG
ncbi:phosphatidylinositol 3- and 4-kinase domain-containing protein [Ditylenchus destructor]|nr:phosphatidylinositol 3- and 4-kinase domain-containing protein [Ditylenchus destructor]